MSPTIAALVSTVTALAVLSLVALADPGPASAGGTQWGDLDCSGSVTPVDSLKTLRKDAGLSVSQFPGCLSPGAEIMIGGLPRAWGDVDCANGINPVDSLKLLRFDAGLLSISAIAGDAACPDIGSFYAIDDVNASNFQWYLPDPNNPFLCDLTLPVPANPPLTGLCVTYDLELVTGNYSIETRIALNGAVFGAAGADGIDLLPGTRHQTIISGGAPQPGTYRIEVIINGSLVGSSSVTVD